MKRVSTWAICLLMVAAIASAAVNTYQVTGPVVEVKADSITVMKGKEKWQVARDGSTKMSATPKVGDTVTIMYRMTATSVEVKTAKKK
jgi:hypothetical protein